MSKNEPKQSTTISLTRSSRPQNKATNEALTNASDSGAYIRHADATMDLLFRGKWQLHILCAMRLGPVRLGQLGRLIPGASKKVLAQSLRKLETRGIVTRRDLSELVLHVEYELRADVRASIGDLLDHLSEWGSDFFILEGRKKLTLQDNIPRGLQLNLENTDTGLPNAQPRSVASDRPK